MDSPFQRRFKRGRFWLGMLSVPIIGAVLWLGGHGGPLSLADHIGYAVCHQITIRTYVWGDLVMPMCARCSGQYLGALLAVGLVWRWGRLRASELPSRLLIAVLIGFLLIWAFDGFNSYMLLILGRPLFYQPNNILRISTGILQGLAVAFLFLPFFNQVFWAQPQRAPVLRRGFDLALAVWLGALLVIVVNYGPPAVFYPLALLSTAATFGMLSIVGTLVALLLLGEENSNRTGRDFFTLFLPGMAFAAIMLLSINLFRLYAESQLGMMLPTG